MNKTSSYSLEYLRCARHIEGLRASGYTGDTRHPKNDRDQLAPDGHVDYGQRIVKKDGSIKIAGHSWQTDLLLPFAGFKVGVSVWDYWCTKILIYWPRYPQGVHLFTIHVADESKHDADRREIFEQRYHQERFMRRNAAAILHGFRPRKLK